VFTATLPCDHVVWVGPLARKPFEGEAIPCPDCQQVGALAYGPRSYGVRGWWKWCPDCDQEVAAFCTGELAPHRCRGSVLPATASAP
jgi:hypothetical protein